MLKMLKCKFFYQIVLVQLVYVNPELKQGGSVSDRID